MALCAGLASFHVMRDLHARIARLACITSWAKCRLVGFSRRRQKQHGRNRCRGRRSPSRWSQQVSR